MLSGAALAQPSVEPLSIDIPALPLNDALKQLAQQAGFQVVFYSKESEGMNAPRIAGRLTATEALRELLAGTALTYEFVNDNTVAIRSRSDESKPSVGKTGERIGTLLMAQADTSNAVTTSAEPTDKTDSSKASLEEVIVTAQKRQESLQDVPFALSALTTADLERIGANGAAEYLAQVPGVHYNAQGRGRSPIIIRGVSTEGSNFSNLQNSIETFVDDLPTLNRWGALTQTDLDTFDVERIEVLRGPQGTLYGSGALGGAIRVITNKPDSSQFDARLQLDGSFTEDGDPSRAINAMINAPLGDIVALRVVGYLREDGGWIDNVRRGEKNVNGGKTTGGRLMFGVKPTEDLNLRLTLMREDNEADDGERTFVPGTGRPYEWDGALPAALDVGLSIANAVVEYDLGSASLISSTTYSDRNSYAVFDAARALVASLDFNFPTVPHISDPRDAIEWIKHDTTTFAQELRMSSSDEGPFLWTLGAFYMNQKVDMRQFWDFGIQTAGGPISLLDSRVHIDTKEAALFGEATYRFNEKFSVTAGARWFDSSFEVSRLADSSFFGGAGLVPTTTDSREVNPKISASFHPVPNVHLYATASQGYRIGQTNFNAGTDPNIPVGYKPDSLWNYELGVKSELLDHRLKVNLAAFFIDWSDIQLTRFITMTNGFDTNITDNAGDAEIKGIEGEIVARASDHWELGTSFAYLDAEIVSVLPGVPDYVTKPGATLPGSPDFSMSNYVQFSSDFGGDRSDYVRFGHRYVGELYSNANNQPFYKVDPYSVLDLRAGMQFSKYEIALYAENLTNRDSVTSADANAEVTPYKFRMRPRTLGMTFRANF